MRPSTAVELPGPFDHIRQKVVLVANVPLDDPERGYNKAVLELEQMAELLRHGERWDEPGGAMTGDVEPLFSELAAFTALCLVRRVAAGTAKA